MSSEVPNLPSKGQRNMVRTIVPTAVEVSLSGLDRLVKALDEQGYLLKYDRAAEDLKEEILTNGTKSYWFGNGSSEVKIHVIGDAGFLLQITLSNFKHHQGRSVTNLFMAAQG